MANKQLAFYVDLSACIGCKACQMACKDKNDLEVGRLYRRVYEVDGGEWVQNGPAWRSTVFAYYVPLACNHCQKPICVEVCPTQAMTKREDGVVLIDAEKCIGCRYCEWACPYGAPQFNEALGKMTKCNFCVDLIDNGESPACVGACPMRAIEFGALDELRAKHGAVNEVYPLPSAVETDPAVVFTPHDSALRAQPESARIANLEEV
jgi:anaerobic dimethyl sulfoxide reductase subunit B